MIPYNYCAKKSMRDQSTFFVCKIAKVNPITLEDVARKIEKISTVSSADIKAVLDSLQYVVIDALKDGNSVRLGDLGSFRPTITSRGRDDYKELTTDDIRRVRCRFTAGGAITRALNKQNLTFRYVGGDFATNPAE